MTAWDGDAPTVQTRREYKSQEQLERMSRAELGDYINAGTAEDDGVPQSIRTALVRLLRGN